MVEGSFASSYMKGEVGWAYSLPPQGAPRAVVIGLYGKNGDQYSVFDAVHLPDAAAHVGAPLAIASANGGPDNYWHKRANGTDAQAMLVEEFVPMLRQELGVLPLTLYGYSMGGYGALLAAERGRRLTTPGKIASTDQGNLFLGVAAASPALWDSYDQVAPGAFDDEADFAANDVFGDVDALRSLAVRLDCGTFDPFYGATRYLSELMTWPHVAEFKPGAAHAMGYWRWSAPAQMLFLAKACGF